MLLALGFLAFCVLNPIMFLAIAVFVGTCVALVLLVWANNRVEKYWKRRRRRQQRLERQRQYQKTL